MCQLKKKLDYQHIINTKLRVWYGFAKLTKKAVRKKQLVIFFENNCYNAEKNSLWIEQKIHIAYIRHQTQEEKTDAFYGNRMFVKYGNYIDEKPWYGNIQSVLENNYIADENHVSIEEREIIKNKLQQLYKQVY